MYQNGALMKTYQLTTHNATQTQALAKRFAQLVRGGEIVFLRGPIGAGKTVFVKGVAAALGLKSLPTSASFSLMKRYQNRRYTLFHIDLFRLSEGEVFNLGFEEMLEDEKAIILAEWPDPIAALMPTDRLEMNFSLCEGDTRQIEITGQGPLSSRLAADLCKQIKK